MSEHGIHHVTAIAGDARRNLDFYTRDARPAARQEDRQLRRSRHLSPLLRRRDRAARHHPDLLPLGACGAGTGRRRPDAGDRVPRAGGLDRLLDPPLRREGRAARGAGEALRRDRAAVQGPGRHGPRARRRRRRRGRERPGAAARCRPSTRSAAFHGVTLLLDDAARTGAILTDVLGFREAAREGALVRYRADAALGGTSTSASPSGFLPGRQGGGSVHHIAFRAADDAEQAAMAAQARRGSPHPPDRAERPQLLPLDLFPRARRRPVRDRDRRARLRRRRAGRRARAGAQAAALPRAAPRARSRRCCRSSGSAPAVVPDAAQRLSGTSPAFAPPHGSRLSASLRPG